VAQSRLDRPSQLVCKTQYDVRVVIGGIAQNIDDKVKSTRELVAIMGTMAMAHALQLHW